MSTAELIFIERYFFFIHSLFISLLFYLLLEFFEVQLQASDESSSLFFTSRHFHKTFTAIFSLLLNENENDIRFAG